MQGETNEDEVTVHYSTTGSSHGLHILEESAASLLRATNEVYGNGLLDASERNLFTTNDISTAFNGGKAQYGAMFDVRSQPSNNVRISSLAFHTLEEVQNCNIQVFTKKGTFENFEEDSSAWKRLKSVTTKCNGPGRKTPISFSEGDNDDLDELRISRGEKRAFYIRAIETQIIYSVADLPNVVFAEDDHVQIFSGVAVGQYFKDFWSPRMLNLEVSYVVEKVWGEQGNTEPEQFGNPIGNDVCVSRLDVMTKDAVNKNYGIMFNIQSNSEKDLTVYGLGFYVDTSAMIEYEMYTLKDGFEHGSAALSLWTKVAQGEKKDARRGDEIVIAESDFAPVKIKGGEKHGFYITLRTENLQYHSTSVTLSSTFLQNKDLTLSSGAGVGGYPFNSNTDFLARRALKGSILYGTEEECRPEILVNYAFVVHYPKNRNIDEVHSEINSTVKKIIKFFLRSDESLKKLSNVHDLELYSVFSQHDANPPAICTDIADDSSCDTIVTKMVFTYKDGDLDEGQVSYKTLEHVNTVLENLNSHDLQVNYSGEETLDTSMLITLAGVPQKAMSNDDVGYFQGVTRGFLKQKESGSLKVLSVEVQDQNLKNRRSLMSGPEKIQKKLVIRVGQEYGTIEIETRVSGKHQPPSPWFDNFEQLVEDSINAEDGGFKEELMKGNQDKPASISSYFQTVREIYAKPISIFPTKAPTPGIKQKSSGLSGPISIAIIVGAALLTFGLVFGAFVYRKRQKDKKKYNKSIFDEDEDDPLFFDVFDAKRGNNNTTVIPPFSRGKSSKRALSFATNRTGGTGTLTEESRKMRESFRMSKRGSALFLDEKSRRDLEALSRGMNERRLDSGMKSFRNLYEGREDENGRNFTGDRIAGPGGRVVTSNSNYEDKVLQKFQNERPSEGNYSGYSTNDYGENLGHRDLGMAREPSRRSTFMERASSRKQVDEIEERIRRKFQGVHEEEARAMPMKQPNSYKYSHEERNRDRDDDFNDEGMRRGETDRQYSSGSVSDYGDRKPPAQDLEVGREWDTRKKKEEKEEQRRGDVHANYRLERRPSEDGMGVSVMSASTSSTLSTHFTKEKKVERINMGDSGPH